MRSRPNLSKVNHRPIFKSCRAYRALPACRLSELLRGCKVGHAANRGGHGGGRALKESPATPKCPHSTKKGTSCGHRSDTFIKSTHVPHFSFFFEVISQTDWEEPKRGGVVSQILACGQIIFPLGGVGPIQSDLNSPTLKYLSGE